MSILPCKPDHNGECLVCDYFISNCPLINFKPCQSHDRVVASLETPTQEDIMGGKYKCLDCEDRGVKSVRFVSRKEASHRARPKCMGCGSPRLELIPPKEVQPVEEKSNENP